MNQLLQKIDKYQNKLITKADFLSEMNEIHNSLFDYHELIQNSNVDKIEITQEGVHITLKNNDIKLYCIKNDKGLVPYVILNFGEYEDKLWNLTAKQINSPRTILDIGGNVGYFSLYFSKLFPSAQFHCFEPVPSTYENMLKNLKINDTVNIKSYNIGLTNKKQTMEMFFNPEGCGSSSLQNLLEAPCTKKILAEFSTLDAFVEENNIQGIDFIKCDVEGAEKFVYEGGLNTLRKYKPIIFSEMLRKWAAKFDYHPNDIIVLLKEIGYSCYAISENEIRLINEVNSETVETNYLFKMEK